MSIATQIGFNDLVCLEERVLATYWDELKAQQEQARRRRRR